MAQSDRAKRRSKKSRKQPLQPPHSLLHGTASRHGVAESASASGDGTGVKPDYNERDREWTFLGRLIKRFRQAAHVQEAILREFERLGWRRCIDNPLPRPPGGNPKRYLRGAIENLNRNQHFPGVEFYADGTGRHICWRPGKGVGRATAQKFLTTRHARVG